MNLQTEFEFTLPRGFLDKKGTLHRKGIMRLATALDEVEPLRDARVHTNHAYLSIVLLARVVTQLGTIAPLTAETIEGLFASDLAFLQTFYSQINEQGVTVFEITCPHCRQKSAVDLARLEE